MPSGVDGEGGLALGNSLEHKRDIRLRANLNNTCRIVVGRPEPMIGLLAVTEDIDLKAGVS